MSTDTVSVALGAAAVSIQAITKTFGDTTALNRVSLDVSRGEFWSILGPSGCGKTTLLRIIAGFEFADSGRIRIDGNDMHGIPPNRRPVNMVFQRYALFPHMTVKENIAFGMKLRRRSKAEIGERVRRLLSLVRLEGYEDRRTSQLSGGQAQRIALARALANEPSVLVMDEPLAGLDLKLRRAMHLELRAIQRAVGSTFIIVTHDQEEALTMSDRVVLMNHGSIEQIATPSDVYTRPESSFVSDFIGDTNLFRGAVASCVADPAGEEFLVSVDSPVGALLGTSATGIPKGSQVWLSVRPEEIEIRSGGEMPLESHNAVNGIIQDEIFLGPFIQYQIAAAGQTVVVQAPARYGRFAFSREDEVIITWPIGSGRLLLR